MTLSAACVGRTVSALREQHGFEKVTVIFMSPIFWLGLDSGAGAAPVGHGDEQEHAWARTGHWEEATI